ncbi:MAG: helix-turn-helix transcriptional regulator [Clostridia bacterium]|nr:helix-turn-helix transcriptional regulator [Clostridia bacterium]
MSTGRAFSRIFRDETLMESVSHGNSAYPFQYYYENIWDFDFHCIDWHWHAELEYLYVKSGKAICFVADDRFELKPGMGLLINSRILHRFEAVEDTIIPNIVFSPSLLAAEESLLYQKYIKPFLESGPACLILDDTVSWQAECLRIMLGVFDTQEEPSPSEWRTVEQLMTFWRILQAELKADEPASHDEDRNHPRLQVMMQYIQEHYREQITLTEIAASAFIGKSTALTVFSQGIHISPVAYLIRYRLKQAAVMLASTEKSVSAVSESCGFQSSGYFCRKFRELYKMSPQTYRRSRQV